MVGTIFDACRPKTDVLAGSVESDFAADLARRGYLGANKRSKQDDAYLITDLTATLYEEEGPSTIVLVAGDADYVPPLERAMKKRWRTEVAFIDRDVSEALEPVVHEFRTISPHMIEYLPGFPVPGTRFR